MTTAVWKSLSNKLIHIQLELIMKSNLTTHTQCEAAQKIARKTEKEKKEQMNIDINESSVLINQSFEFKSSCAIVQFIQLSLKLTCDHSIYLFKQISQFELNTRRFFF